MNITKHSILALLLSAGSISAQDTIPLSGNEIANRVREGNLSVQIAKQVTKSALADYRQSAQVFLPSVNASITAMTTTNPLMAFGSKLNQEVLTASDFNTVLLNNPDKTQNVATKVELLQPIVNVDGWYARAAAKSKMEAYQFQGERTVEQLVFEAEKAYLQLELAYRAVKVLETADATTSANLSLINRYFEQGLVQKTDVLNVTIRQQEVRNQLATARSNVRNASAYLAFLMGDDQTTVYKPAEALELATATELTIPETRKDLAALDKTTQAYRQMYQSGKMAFLPRFNAFANYELFDRNLPGMRANGYTVGAQLSWSVFDGYKSIGKMEKARAELEKSKAESAQYKAQSQLELDKTLRELTDAENQVKLAQLAYEQSAEVYRIRQNRFAQGLEKPSDLLLAETQRAQKEMELAQATTQLEITKRYLQLLTK